MSSSKRFYGWEYGADRENNFFINPPPELGIIKPETLFKYYSMNDYSLSVLENMEIFAPHPKLLNDPYDTHESLIIFDDYQAIANFLGDILKEYKQKDKPLEEDEDFRAFVAYNFRIVLYGSIGIYSMTTNPTNLLMWSYYAEHKGFCIEFDYHRFPFKHHGPFPMNYQNRCDPISIKNGGIICAIYQSNLKSAEWSHEQEWRILPEKKGPPLMESKGIDALDELTGLADRKFSIDRSCISKIILGNQFFDNDNEMEHSSRGLEIKLKSNQDQKTRLLNKVLELGIPIEMIMRNEDLFSLRTEPITIAKTAEGEYLIQK